MVFLAGIGGFIGGFVLGLLIIGIFLRQRSKKDLLQDNSLRWTYGLLVWLVAAIGAWSAVVTYNHYFS